MIDISSERLITLAEAARDLPCRRAGRKTNVATLYRWTIDGCRGIRLEYIQVGASRCTSKEAVQRFFDALTAQTQGREPAAPLPAKPTAGRRKQIAAAERKLAAAGV